MRALLLVLGGLVATAALILLLLSTDTSIDAPALANGAALPDPGAVYDPVQAGEHRPSGYRQVLDRDQIRPVYRPEFTSLDLVDWPADMLVIGVAGEESAKAYPVTHLNQREMVIDFLEGTPILVSW